MKTIEMACKEPGITSIDFGLNLHFSPIPNWYHCFLGFDCPICGNPIDWKWKVGPARIEPIVTEATLIGYGHRWIRLECDKCHTKSQAEIRTWLAGMDRR